MASSTSSSEISRERTSFVDHRSRSAVARRLAAHAAWLHRIPTGGLLAFLLVILFHIVWSQVVVPRPIPRADSRILVPMLTEGRRPSIILAGDSRTCWGVDPAIAAKSLDVPESDLINIARSGCTMSNTRLIFDSYGDRFSPNAVVTIAVSPFWINDGSPIIRDETLWQLDLVDRFALTDTARFLQSFFIPELSVTHMLTINVDKTCNGFMVQDSPYIYDADGEAVALESIWASWFDPTTLDGIRWRLFKENVEHLKSQGLQLVIVSLPIAPALSQYLDRKPGPNRFDAFETHLEQYADAKGLPFLRYRAENLCPEDPRQLFCDLVHVNANGAKIVSEAIGHDLRKLIDEHRVHLPNESASRP